MKKSKAFTLAEVLITLVIIGVVSALVIPSVLKNYNDKKYNTARLKALKTFGEAGKLASINGEMNSQSNATDFVNNVLSKYLKITKVCTFQDSTNCGFPSEIQPSDPTVAKKKTKDLAKWNQLGGYNTDDTNMSKVVSVSDGFSALIYYNPKCVRNIKESSYNFDATCMNIIYDMNGLKGPNHVGEDIGIVTLFWSGLKALTVAPYIAPHYVNSVSPLPWKNQQGAMEYCKSMGNGKKSYRLPNLDELSSVYMNASLVSFPHGNPPTLWSSSKGISSVSWIGVNGGWAVFPGCSRNLGFALSSYQVWCIRE